MTDVPVGAGGCIELFPPGNPTEIRTDPLALHDWRLLTREWDGNRYGYRPMSGWQETWYCTRCRLVDEKRLP